MSPRRRYWNTTVDSDWSILCHLMQLRELGDWNFGSPPSVPVWSMWSFQFRRSTTVVSHSWSSCSGYSTISSRRSISDSWYLLTESTGKRNTASVFKLTERQLGQWYRSVTGEMMTFDRGSNSYEWHKCRPANKFKNKITDNRENVPELVPRKNKSNIRPVAGLGGYNCCCKQNV